MEPIKINTSCKAAKKMPTTRTKRNDVEILTCSIGLGVMRISREVGEQLAGFPVDTWRSLFDEKGFPRQRTGLILPKRELVVAMKLEHRRDSGAAISTLDVKMGAITSLQFNLDAPDDSGECVVMAFTSTWKAAGDEVSDVEAILGRPCWIVATFKEPPLQEKLFADSKGSAAKEAAAGKRNSIDRKSLAAGEKPPPDKDPPDALIDDAKRFVSILEVVALSELQTHLKIGYNRAARIMEQLVNAGVLGDPVPGEKHMTRAVLESTAASPAVSVAVVGKNFERDAQEKARKNPRREPAKPKHTGRK